MPADPEEFLPTRWSLLERLKAWDDQASWRDFLETYWRLIYATATKAGLTHTEAEEVVQETIISVAKNIGEFRASPDRGSFKSWLMNLTRWRITDQVRRRKRVEQLAGQPCKLNRPGNDDTARTATIERVPDASVANVEADWEAE
jgi:RNA polymerase sigma-70 factor (ECF subfamily)